MNKGLTNNQPNDIITIEREKERWQGMDTFYVFDEYGDFQFTTTDEDFASVWCDENAGYYSCQAEMFGE